MKGNRCYSRLNGTRVFPCFSYAAIYTHEVYTIVFHLYGSITFYLTKNIVIMVIVINVCLDKTNSYSKIKFISFQMNMIALKPKKVRVFHFYLTIFVSCSHWLDSLQFCNNMFCLTNVSQTYNLFFIPKEKIWFTFII